MLRINLQPIYSPKLFVKSYLLFQCRLYVDLPISAHSPSIDVLKSLMFMIDVPSSLLVEWLLRYFFHLFFTNPFNNFPSQSLNDTHHLLLIRSNFWDSFVGSAFTLQLRFTDLIPLCRSLILNGNLPYYYYLYT